MESSRSRRRSDGIRLYLCCGSCQQRPRGPVPQVQRQPQSPVSQAFTGHRFQRQPQSPASQAFTGHRYTRVGLNDKVQEVLRLLQEVERDAEAGVLAILLQGPDGIGKTTLAEAVCTQLRECNDFNFARIEMGENPSTNTICKFRIKILDTLSGKNQRITDCAEGQQELKNYLALRKSPVLLFFDNVFCMKDVINLISPDLIFPDGSRIVITSRVELPGSQGLSKRGIACRIYPVPALEDSLARQLLKQYLRECPPEREVQVNSILQSCGGFPLAIQIIGAYLHSRWDDESAWHSAVECLQSLNIDSYPEKQLDSILEWSYVQLTRHAQQGFLDISCLLRDVEWDWVKAVHGSSLDLLQNRSLVRKHLSLNARLPPRDLDSILSMESFTVGGSFYDTTRRWLCGDAPRVHLHHHLETFGQNLSQATTRLRAGEGDNLPSLLQAGDQGNCDDVEGIVIRGCTEPLPATKLDAACKSLRILLLEDAQIEGKCSEDPSRLEICSTPNGFPFKDPSLLNNLRVLEIGVRVDFDFERVQFPKLLEILKLSRLAMLKHFHPQAFERCSRLHTFEVLCCPALEDLPPLSFCHLKTLRVLILLGNKALRSIPMDFYRLESLQTLVILSLRDKNQSGFEGLVPQDFSRLTRLENVTLDCAQTQQLPSGLGLLQFLKRLNILGCESTRMLPDDFRNLSLLTEMRLAGCRGLRTLPNDFWDLRELSILELGDCPQLVELPDGISQLTSLKKLTLKRCQSLGKLPDGICALMSLEQLTLTLCESLDELPQAFGQLTNLSELCLGKCDNLRRLSDSFGELKSLHTLTLTGCTALTELPEEFGKLTALSRLNLDGCDSLRKLPSSFCELKSLKTFTLTRCKELKELPTGFEKLSALSILTLTGCQVLTLPTGFGKLRRRLSRLDVEGCEALQQSQLSDDSQSL